MPPADLKNYCESFLTIYRGKCSSNKRIGNMYIFCIKYYINTIKYNLQFKVTHCGSQTPEPVLVQGNEACVVFQSDVPRKGFQIQWAAVGSTGKFIINWCCEFTPLPTYVWKSPCINQLLFDYICTEIYTAIWCYRSMTLFFYSYWMYFMSASTLIPQIFLGRLPYFTSKFYNQMTQWKVAEVNLNCLKWVKEL